MVKNPPANAGDTRDAGSIPGWGRSPGEGNGNPLQYSCLGNPMDRGVWHVTVGQRVGHDFADKQQTSIEVKDFIWWISDFTSSTHQKGTIREDY